MKKALNWIGKGFFGWMKDFFIGTFKELGTSLGGIKQSPLLHGLSLAVIAARITALIMLVIAFLSFIADSGYGRQIDLITSGFGQWPNALTTGGLSEYLGGFAASACAIFLVLSFFAIYIAYIIREEGVKKGLMVTLMIVLLFAVLLYLLARWGLIFGQSGRIDSFDALRQFARDGQGQKTFLFIYIAAVVLALSGASFMTMKSELNRQMRQWLSTVLSVYIGLPLLMWFAQNLIPLAAITLFCAIVYGLLALLSSNLGSGSEKRVPVDGHPGENPATTDAPRRRYTSGRTFGEELPGKNGDAEKAQEQPAKPAKPSEPAKPPKPAKAPEPALPPTPAEPEPKKNTIKGENYSWESGVKFTRDVDFKGQRIIRWETDMGYGTVCTEKEFDDGTHIIIRSGKRVSKIE